MALKNRNIRKMNIHIRLLSLFIFGQNVEFLKIFRHFLIVSQLTSFVYVVQLFSTTVYNENQRWKSDAKRNKCGKLSGKSAKLQQNHDDFQLFHALGVWKS